MCFSAFLLLNQAYHLPLTLRQWLLHSRATMPFLCLVSFLTSWSLRISQSHSVIILFFAIYQLECLVPLSLWHSTARSDLRSDATGGKLAYDLANHTSGSAVQYFGRRTCMDKISPAVESSLLLMTVYWRWRCFVRVTTYNLLNAHKVTKWFRTISAAECPPSSRLVLGSSFWFCRRLVL